MSLSQGRAERRDVAAPAAFTVKETGFLSRPMGRSRIIAPLPRLVGRAETAPELVFHRRWLSNFVSSVIQHAEGRGSPRPGPWYALAATPETPRSDPRVVTLEMVEHLIATRCPEVAAVRDWRATQVVADGRHTQVRLNERVRGLLTARLEPDPANPRKPFLQLGFEPGADEPEHASYFVALRWNDQGRSSAIIFWDTLNMDLRSFSPAELGMRILRGLPPGAPRRRWNGLVEQTSANEIPSIYLQTGRQRLDSKGFSSRALEMLEASVLAGRPSRKSHLDWVPLDEPDAPEGEALGLASPSDVASDVEMADELSRLGLFSEELSARGQEILHLYYYENLTDEEIGSKLGISHQAVNKARNAALMRLRERMSG